MSGLDLLLLLPVALSALAGYRRGLIVGVLGFTGFLAGGVAGAALAPRVVGDWEAGLAQALAAVVLVVGSAAVGQVLLGWLGSRLRARLTWRPARLLDAGLGAALSVVAVLVVAWFLAAALRQAPVPALARQISGSQLLRAVDTVMPDSGEGLFASFRDLLDDRSFPRVFAGLAPERIAPVAPPTGRADTPEVAAAAGSVVLVTGAAECGRRLEGSGFVYAPERVMTNAHVVAGVEDPVVRVRGRRDGYPAEVVAYDPARDLAVLAVPGLGARPLAFDAGVERGDEAVAAGFPSGGPYALKPARVREEITVRGPDIYGSSSVTRRVLSLHTSVEPGNSGGPLLSRGGRVVGVVFARSLEDDRTGYALTVREAEPVARAGSAARAPVDTGACSD